MDIKGNDFAIAIAGLGVTPDTVDTMLLLRVVTDYMRAMLRVADEEGIDLSFHGLRIVEGSAAAVSIASDIGEAKHTAQLTNEKLRSADPPSYLNPLISSIDQLSVLACSLYVANDNWSEAIRQAPNHELHTVEETVRVTVIRAGGVAPAIRVESVLFPECKFTIKTTREEAIDLSKYLYRQIEVRIVAKSEGNNYVDAQLIEYEEVDEVSNPREAWSNWYKSTGAIV